MKRIMLCVALLLASCLLTACAPAKEASQEPLDESSKETVASSDEGGSMDADYGNDPENVVDEARFRQLSEGVTYAQMVDLLGYPTLPVGSGLWIDGYELTNGGLGLVWLSNGEHEARVEHTEVWSADYRAVLPKRNKVYAAIGNAQWEMSESLEGDPSSAYPDLNDSSSLYAKLWEKHFSGFDASDATFVLDWIFESDENGFFEAFLVSGANRLAGRTELLGAANSTEEFTPYACSYDPYTPKWYAFQLQSILNA